MPSPTKTGVTTYTTLSDREVAIARTFDAPRRLVYEAYTSCQHIRRWMLGPEGWTMPICEMDLRPGGKYRWGWRKADGAEMEIVGVFKEVVPPERLVASELWGPTWPETVNTVVFTEVEGRTTITCTITYPSREARDAALQSGMKRGMDMSYDRLDHVLAALA